MKYLGIFTIILATSLITATLTQRMTTINTQEGSKSAEQNSNSDKEFNKQIKSLHDQLKTISQHLTQIKSKTNSNTGENGPEGETVERVQSAPFNTNTQSLEEILNLLRANQDVLLTSAKKGLPLSKTDVTRMINNQSTFLETIKDMQWQQTDTHYLDIADLKELDRNILTHEKRVLLEMVTDFPLHVSLATSDIETTVKEWNYRAKENWELLMNADQGSGVFYLHMSLADLIKNKSSYKVIKFIKDIKHKTQIVVYHNDFSTFLDILHKSSNARFFEDHKHLIRLDIGNNFAALHTCRSREQLINFLQTVRVTGRNN